MAWLLVGEKSGFRRLFREVIKKWSMGGFCLGLFLSFFWMWRICLEDMKTEHVSVLSIYGFLGAKCASVVS